MKQTYQSLDASNNGQVTLDTIAQKLDPNQLPCVKEGRLSDRDGYMEFMGQFNSRDRESVVACDEFVQVHRLLSGAISSDEEFGSVLRGCWAA